MDFRKLLPIRSACLGVKYFDKVFTYFNNPIILLSLTGEILRCNKAACELFNLESSQVVNRDYFAVCRQQGINTPFISLKEMLENPKPSITVVNHHLQPAKTVQWEASPVKDNDQIESICLQGFDITPISNTSMVEKLLQNSIIDNLPNYFIFWKDRNSVFLGCNKAFALSVHLSSPADIVGKTDYDLPWSKEESDRYIADDRQVMEAQTPKLNIEEPQTLSDGRKIILSTSKVPLFDEKNKVYGILAIYSDVTQQKVNEQKLIETNKKLENAYQAKSEFIRNVSHDIRTPLSGIQQMTRAVADGIISEEEIPEYALFAWEASNKLMELFDQIIDISKKEHFDFEEQVVKFDLYKLLQGLGKTYEIVAKHKQLKLEIEYSAQIPHYLVGKHFRLHRILMNLLGNALKFTEKGSVKLLVEKAQETQERVVLRFSVIDTGMGIAPEKHQAIFEPFTRLTPSFENQYKGSGLGLHVVKDYIEKMQGEIYVESEEGEGSMFTCLIPFKRPILDNDNDVTETEYVQNLSVDKVTQLKEHSHETKTHSIEITPSTRYRVLLVEDDKMAQMMGVMLLKDKGYQVNLAKSWDEALELTAKNTYDIIYMDIGLGSGIDGIETTKRIRANEHNLSQHAFITALTAHGHTDETIVNQCKEAGMQYILSKPLSSEKIIQIHTLATKNNKHDTHAEISVIDFDLWLSRLGGASNMLEELVHIFGQNFDNNRRNIKQAYEAHDLLTLKAMTHKFKGALLYSGFPRLEKAMIAIESASKKGNVEEVDKWYPEIMEALDEAENAYKEWAKTHPKQG